MSEDATRRLTDAAAAAGLFVTLSWGVAGDVVTLTCIPADPDVEPSIASAGMVRLLDALPALGFRLGDAIVQVDPPAWMLKLTRLPTLN